MAYIIIRTINDQCVNTRCHLLCRYFSVSIFYKIGISGFIAAIIICLSLITAQILVLLIADKVSPVSILSSQSIFLSWVVNSGCIEKTK